jgi:hypothetical protein
MGSVYEVRFSEQIKHSEISYRRVLGGTLKTSSRRSEEAEWAQQRVELPVMPTLRVRGRRISSLRSA